MAQTQKNKRNLWSWTGHIRAQRPRRQPEHVWRRRRFIAAVLLIILCTVVSCFYYYTADERIRLQAIKTLSNLTGGEVEVDHASLVILEGIRIKGLRLYLPDLPHTPENIFFSADDVMLEHRSSSIVRQQLILERIVANGATLHIRYQPQTNWFNLRSLHLKPGPRSGRLPAVMLRNATLEYTEITDPCQPQVARQVVSGRLTPVDENPDVYQFTFAAESEGIVSTSNLGKDHNTLTGHYNLRTGSLDSTAILDLDTIDLSGLPERTEQWQNIYQISQPHGTITTQTSYNPDGDSQLLLTLTNVSLNIPVGPDSIPLYDVNANMLFTPEQITIENMDANTPDGRQFSVVGQINGYALNAPAELNVTVNNLNIPAEQWNQFDDANEPLPHQVLVGLNELIEVMPPQTANLIHQCQPTGTMNLLFHLNRSGDPNSQFQISGNVDCVDVAVRHERFPYPLSGIQGNIYFSPNRIDIGPLHAQRGEQTVTLEGNWHKDQLEEGYDIYVTSLNMPLDQTLYDALQPQQQQIWDKLNCQGAINANVHQYYHGDYTQQLITIQLLDITAQPQPMPIEFTNMVGTITRHPDAHIDFNIDQAQALDGIVEAVGRIENLDMQQPGWNCQIDFHNILVDEEFSAALPEELANRVRQTGYQGRADGQINLAPTNADSVDPNGSVMDRYGLHLRSRLYQGTMLHQDLPYQLDNVQAEIELDPDQLTVHSLQATHNASDIIANGRMELNDGYEFHVEAANLPIDDELRQLLGRHTESFWQSFNPSGTVNIRADLQTHNDQDLDYRADIDLVTGQLRPAQIEYLFDNIQGQITIQPQQITIHHLNSQTDQCRINLTGNIMPQLTSGTESQANQYAYLLQLQIDSLQLNENTRTAMPPQIRQLMEQLEINGLANLDMQISHRTADIEGGGNWDFNGIVSIQDGSAAYPVSVNNVAMQLAGQAFYEPSNGVFRLNGRLNSENITFDQKDITQLSADVDYDNNQHQLTIDQIVGNMCQGRIGGDIQANFVDSNLRYQLALQLLNLELPEYLGSDAQSEGTVEGKVNGHIAMRSQGPIATREGSFNFAVTEATLGELPLLTQLLSVLDLSLPQDNAFREADIQGSIIGERINFDYIQLRSDSLNLTGKGRMTQPDDQLAIAFAVDVPEFLANVPVVGSFTSSFVNPSLVKVRVTGTFESPNVEPVAFPTFDAALNEIDSGR